MRAVYEPKVIRLDSGEGVPVQSNIDGAKYAAFIDESVAFCCAEDERAWGCIGKNGYGKVESRGWKMPDQVCQRGVHEFLSRMLIGA